MKTFLVCTSIAVFLIGLALTAIPAEAQIGFPATLTPYPTFDGSSYNSPAQATLARQTVDMIWWEHAPYIDLPNPRPGFVLFVIQWWNWIDDTTHQMIMYSILLMIVILITLRFAHRVKTWGEKADGASVTKNEIRMGVDQADVDKFMAGR